MSDALSAAGQVGEERPSSEAPVRLLQSEWLWAWVLVAGAAIWLVTAVATGLTDLDHLIPNVVLLGSFLVPVSLVLFALARTSDGYLSVEHVILGFLGGGTIGTVFAGITEVYFLPSAAATFVGVGLFEETAKALVVVLIGTRVPVRRGRDGMILGATVGAGFAAFESGLRAEHVPRPPRRSPRAEHRQHRGAACPPLAVRPPDMDCPGRRCDLCRVA